MDRRRIRRRRQRVTVQMEPGGITSFTGDIGSGGLFLSCLRVHRPGTRVRLVVRLPSGPAEVEGVVRWAKRVPATFVGRVKGGMGIEFTWISPEFQAYLDERESPIRSAV